MYETRLVLNYGEHDADLIFINILLRSRLDLKYLIIVLNLLSILLTLASRAMSSSLIYSAEQAVCDTLRKHIKTAY